MASSCAIVPFGSRRWGLVVAGVVADLEAVAVESGDLVPGHVVALVGRDVEALGDEERRAEAVLLEQRGGHLDVRPAGVVEGQDNELVRDRLQGEGRSVQGEEEQHGGQAHGAVPAGNRRMVGRGGPTRSRDSPDESPPRRGTASPIPMVIGIEPQMRRKPIPETPEVARSSERMRWKLVLARARTLVTDLRQGLPPASRLERASLMNERALGVISRRQSNRLIFIDSRACTIEPAETMSVDLMPGTAMMARSCRCRFVFESTIRISMEHPQQNGLALPHIPHVVGGAVPVTCASPGREDF